jgi:hypothetical protein
MRGVELEFEHILLDNTSTLALSCESWRKNTLEDFQNFTLDPSPVTSYIIIELGLIS